MFKNVSGSRGFTIVELLIVIVVIAILAAISITAYNGIQQRARNTQVVAGVNTYYKALLQYKTINSTYPIHSGCLGANYPSNGCWFNGSTVSIGVNNSLDTALAEFVPSKPTLATSVFPIGISNYERAGLYYRYNEPTYGDVFFWYLQGINQNCGLNGAVLSNEGGVVSQCRLSLPQ